MQPGATSNPRAGDEGPDRLHADVDPGLAPGGSGCRGAAALALVSGRMMSKLPYLPLFFGDFLASTFTWTGKQQSLYLLLLGYQWVSGPLPKDLPELAQAVRYDIDEFSELWKRVGTKFIETDEGFVNVRLEEHRAKTKTLSAKRAKAGAKGGRPSKQKAKANGAAHA